MSRGHCDFPWLAVSEDGATTWQRVQISDHVSAATHEVSLAVDAADVTG